MNEYDVIVVGAGGSGLAAAARGTELGLSVLVLEKQSQPGGTTGIAVGSLTANRTQYQQQAGIEDSIDAHAEDAGRFADAEIEKRNNVELRRFFLSHSAATVDWLCDMGLAFHGPSPEPPNRVPRMHNVVPNARAYIAALQAKTLRGGGRIVCEASVGELLSSQGRVTGVVAETGGTCETFMARRGVVLAAGDYASSSEFITRFKGGLFADVEGINPYSLGDGHQLAESVGARLLNMDVTYGPELRFVPSTRRNRNFAQLLPASGIGAWLAGKLLPWVPTRILNAVIKRLLVTWQHPENRLFEEGAILVNLQGQRFCDESLWPDRELAVARQTDKSAYILLDQRLADHFSRWPNFISTAPEIAYAYVNDYLRLRPDVAVTASGLDEIAVLRNLPKDALQRTVSETNIDRADSDMALLGDGPWVLLGPVRSYFTTTEGGAAINQQFEVLNEDDRSIPGLYAVGQNGLGGQILWGHGLHIAWAITSGRMVAEHLVTVPDFTA